MNWWNRLRTWALKDDPVVQEQAERIAMVGEPVISFIESLHREPRRYVIKQIDAFEYRGKKHTWMTYLDFYELTDKKTGDVYQGVIHDNKLYQVTGLPFELNGWEHAVIYKAIVDCTQTAMHRHYRMMQARNARERQETQQRELVERAEYAKRFQENAE